MRRLLILVGFLLVATTCQAQTTLWTSISRSGTVTSPAFSVPANTAHGANFQVSIPSASQTDATLTITWRVESSPNGTTWTTVFSGVYIGARNNINIKGGASTGPQLIFSCTQLPGIQLRIVITLSKAVTLGATVTAIV